MRRIPQVARPLGWQNPLKEHSPRPYLDGPVFPVQRGTKTAHTAMDVLRRFYTPQRVNGDADARRFRQFIAQPAKHVFIVWGDIGVGKSWFVRYQLADMAERHPQSVYYGVIDMLRASPHDAKEKLIQQMIVTIEQYFVDNFGSLEKGLRPLAEFRARMRYGESADVAALRQEVTRLTNEMLESTGTSRAEYLMDALENADGPALFIAVDNLDRALGDEQHALTDLVARMFRNARIHLIFPLRSSSGILLDESKILGFFEKEEMRLSGVDFAAMLRPRFAMDEKGTDLSNVRLPPSAGSNANTYPELLEQFLEADGGAFVRDLAGNNSRKTLDFVSRILYSNQLDAVENIRVPESCIAALLMHDDGSFYPELSYILNLFDNGEPRGVGNSLIRFRTLELIHDAGPISAKERRFQDFFARLGYSIDRVTNVIATFVGAGLVKTEVVLTADAIRQRGLNDLGWIAAIDQGVSQYFDGLLSSPWYFICVKRGIHVDEEFIARDDRGAEYLPDGNLVDFLKREEDDERKRIRYYEARFGARLGNTIKLRQAFAIANAALNNRSRRSSYPKLRAHATLGDLTSLEFGDAVARDVERQP